MEEVEMTALREFSRIEDKSTIRYQAGDIVKVPSDRVAACELTGKAQLIVTPKKGK